MVSDVHRFAAFLRDMKVDEDTTVKVCARCGEPRPHRKRGDAETLRSSCVECQAKVGAAWRAKNWIRCKLRNTWRLMISRCHNHADKSYRRYGARGVTVCLRWRGPDGLAKFMLDVGEPPSKAHTLDRKVGTLGYSKHNVRWATLEEQNRNRCSTHFIEAVDPTTGELMTKTLGEWSRFSGTNRHTIAKRLMREWSEQEAIFGPVVPF